MKHMTFGQRIAAVGCLVLLVVSASLFYFITKGFSKDIAVAVTEQYGDQYQRPLEQLLESIPTHQLLARRYLRGQRDVEAQMREAAGRVDAAMEALRTVDARLGEALQFTPEGLAKRKREHATWNNLHQEWESLKTGQAGQTVENSDQLHAHLVSDVRTMIAHAGDTSNLILDSDLDSYYLMDATLVALPQTQERLAEIEMLGRDALRDGRMGNGQRMQLAVAAAMLKEADLDRTMGDIQTSLNEDQNFNGVSETLQQNLPPETQAYSKATEALLEVMRKMSDTPGARVTEAEFAAAASGAREASFALWNGGVQELDVLLQKRIDALARTRLWALALTALALLLAGAIAGWVIRSALRSLRAAAEQLLNHSRGIAASSEQIACGSQEVASGACQQAAALEETSASAEEINSVARKNGETSRSAAGLVIRFEGQLDNANHSLDQLVESVCEINAESEKISKIIKVIDAIAFQTNILALNAAVEAARAGDGGLGFAVVAEEVRNLAQRSAQSARDTAALIETSIAKSGDGKRKVGQMAGIIRAITAESASLKALVNDVDRCSQEQTRGVEQVAKAIAQMEQVTHKNAAHAEESAAAAAELSARSAELREAAGQVTALVGGTPAGRTA